jgi:hypothetical protein
MKFFNKWQCALAVLADGVAGRRADGRAPVRQPGRPLNAQILPVLLLILQILNAPNIGEHLALPSKR